MCIRDRDNKIQLLFKKNELGEANAVLPDTKWLAEHRPNDPTWKQGDTYNVSIGEGGLVLTPLQMAGYIATIANDGILMQPHLLKSEKPEEKLHLGVDLDNLKIVQEGMREVILSGTAETCLLYTSRCV